MVIHGTRRPEVRQGNSYIGSSINLINRLLRISVKPLQILPSPETGDLTLSFPSLLLDPAVDSSPFPCWLMALQSCLGARPCEDCVIKVKETPELKSIYGSGDKRPPFKGQRSKGICPYINANQE